MTDGGYGSRLRMRNYARGRDDTVASGYAATRFKLTETFGPFLMVW